jgi:uncharacterized protein YcfJ
MRVTDRMTIQTKFAALALALLSAVAGRAEDAGQWSNLQGLRKGDRIGVIQGNQKRVEGRFESATDSRITLRADREISLEKSDVVRVYRPARHGRVLGGAIGVAAGGVLDGTVGVRFRNEGDSPAKGLLTAAGAGVGVGIGAAVTGWYRTVYQREK